MRKVDLTKLFSSGHLCIETFDAPAMRAKDDIPAIDKNYIFDLPLLNQVLLYLAYPQKDCLFLSGPAGCGKTSVALQVAARLGWGVQQLTLSARTEASDLIGHTTLSKGQLFYEYGPLVKAMKSGEILILNEIDLMPPGELSALNDVLEGRPLIIAQNCGECIKPDPFFRVIATANTKGMGDPLGFYSGTRQLNQAFLDRWRFVEVSYPKEHSEIAIVSKACPGLGSDFVRDLVRLATELRRTSCPEQGRASLSAPFSTRVLIRVAGMMSVCSKLSVQKAVDTAFAARLPDSEREYVMRLCADIFGNGQSDNEMVGRRVSPNMLDPQNDYQDADDREDEEVS